jgi:hypothetical protein
MLQSTNSDHPPSWSKIEGDYELRNTVEFPPQQSEESSTIIEDDFPPPLPSPTKKRKILLAIGLTLTALDLCILPITLFYSLSRWTSLTKQYGEQRIH